MVNSALLVGNAWVTGLKMVLDFGWDNEADLDGPDDIIGFDLTDANEACLTGAAGLAEADEACLTGAAGLTEADEACLTGAGFTEADEACLTGAAGFAEAFLTGAEEVVNKLLIESPPTMISSVRP
jgi:hypothetical protein